MACTQEASYKFVPFLFNNFTSRGYIQEGAQTSSPYRKGIKDLAQNNNTIWANIGPSLVNDNRDDSTTVVMGGAGTFTFAYYKVKPPLYLPPTGTTGRKMLTVYVYAKTTAGVVNWTFTATTPEGTATSASTAGAGAWVGVDVPCTRNAVEQLKLELTVAGACTASVMNVIVYAKKDTTADITGTNSPYDNDTFIPLDLAHYDADSPLSVVALQHLHWNNEILYKYNKRSVVTFCTYDNLGTSYSGTTPTLCTSMDNTNDRLEPRMEWIYFPRQGVKTLSVYLIGHVASWLTSADDATVRLAFKGSDSYVQGTIGAAASAFTSTWPINGSTLTVPNGPGPHIIELSLDDEGKRCYISAVCIIED